MPFQKLFHYIWDHGLGNKVSAHGDSSPWTDKSLEAALFGKGYSIDKRSIQHWHKGNHKPSIPNIHALAKVISNGDFHLKQQWADALIASLRYKPITTEPIAPTPPLPKIPTQAKSTETGQLFIPSRLRFIAEIFGMGLIAILAFIIIHDRLPESKTNTPIRVTNIKFCDDDRFSVALKTCQTNVTHFDSSLEKVYVSFHLIGAPEGHPFERRWYFNGENFLEKEGFYDAAWEDYTWLSFGEPFKVGKYDLRIIVDGKVETSTFFVTK